MCELFLVCDGRCRELKDRRRRYRGDGEGEIVRSEVVQIDQVVQGVQSVQGGRYWSESRV
jgi:hypothetical protein